MNRKDFQIFNKTIYLDSAAAVLKPQSVIDAISHFYANTPINSHSSQSKIGVEVVQKIQAARQLVGNLVDASANEVIFTSGTTDSLNKIALMLKDKIQEGDEILISYYNHSSHIVPWIEIAKAKKAKIIYTKDFLGDINKNTKVIALASQNNTVNVNLNFKKIYELATKFDAIVVNDAAQAISHKKVTLKVSHVIAFSGNKLFGPTGIGALVINQELLSTLKPPHFGGGATVKIEDDNWILNNSIKAFEPGTPNIAGIIGFGEAIKFFNNNKDFKYEKELAIYAYEKLSAIQRIKFYSKKGDTNILFNVGNYAAQDVVSYLGHKNIIIRSGAHCAKMLYKVIEVHSTIRVSIAAYNNKSDIDTLVKTIKAGGDFIEFI